MWLRLFRECRTSKCPDGFLNRGLAVVLRTLRIAPCPALCNREHSGLTSPIVRPLTLRCQLRRNSHKQCEAQELPENFGPNSSARAPRFEAEVYRCHAAFLQYLA
jgi:hypothetical protein